MSCFVFFLGLFIFPCAAYTEQPDKPFLYPLFAVPAQW